MGLPIAGTPAFPFYIITSKRTARHFPVGGRRPINATQSEDGFSSITFLARAVRRPRHAAIVAHNVHPKPRRDR